ncbi:MAG: class I SAM-dependent methyltransferase [Candidatus Odinarchaeota archaeon]|nr:class I SAM-dependent methyltransferase [Candidatus Odinarchaeota archaeon]
MSGEAWIKKMYDQTSRIYDERYREIQLLKYNLVVDNFVGKFERILDVGCGTGLFSYFLRDKGILNSSTLVGIDISPGMVRRANDKGYDLIVLGNAERLPFLSDSFDLVVSFTLLQNIEDVSGFIDEIVRVSKRGATVIISIIRKSVKKLAKLLKDSKHLNGELRLLEVVDNHACEDVIYVFRRV